jgi:two-component system, NarL family, sensor kinase
MTENNDLIYSVIVTTSVILLMAVFIILFVAQQLRRKQKHLLEKQQLQAQYQQDLLNTQLEIQEQILKTISGEIHDNIGQTLSLAKLNLNTLLLQKDDTDRKKVDTALEQVSKAINDLRDLGRSLHGDKITEIGLEEAIAGQLKIIQNSSKFTTSLNITGTPYPLEPRQEMVLFRMAQEIINNALKHSKARHIAVTLAFTPAGSILSVSDDGVGFDARQLDASKTGIGLTNLYSRAALINAKVCLQSSPGIGTTISVEIMNSQ